MDQERIKKGIIKRPELRSYEDKCTQNFPPACVTKCPMHVDAKGICEAIAGGDFSAALKLFRKAIVFPGIISHICDRPCQSACRRGEIGDSILISKLEQAAVTFGSALKKKIRPMRERDGRIAIIGAGLEGLAAALFLYEKGYQVTIIEKTDRLGGRIWDSVADGRLPEAAIEEDFAVFREGKIEILRQEIPDKNALTGLYKSVGGLYDAVYDTVLAPNRQPGGYGDHSLIQKLADGRANAITLDRMLQQVSLTEGRENEGPYDTLLYVNLEGFEPLPSVIPDRSPEPLTEAQARKEADRCIRCDCLECLKVCPYLDSMGEYPKKYAREISNNLNITMGLRQTKNMVNGCAVCGLCKHVCPNGFDMAELCMTARVGLVDIFAMPEATFEFPIRDMEYSNGENYRLIRHEPGKTASRYLFFPGCQLGALQPLHVEQAYDFLREHLSGGVGLALACCGAPAYWSGRMETFESVMAAFKKDWEAMGRPQLITACTSCAQMFGVEAPDIEIRSLWQFYDDFIEELEPAESTRSGAAPVLSVHDACTARDNEEVQAAVRRVIHKKGYVMEELPCSGKCTKCCGYGGLVYIGDRAMCKAYVEDRVSESPNDFAVYCAMCKELMTEGGKPSWHILDLIYGDAGADPKSTDQTYLTFSRRQENKRKLKEKMQRERWGETMDREPEAWENMELVFDDSIEQIADDRLILESDIRRVIYEAEQTCCKVLNPKNGHFTASCKPGIITYWVEYSPEEGENGTCYRIYRAYSHRLEINKKIKENEHRKYRI